MWTRRARRLFKFNLGEYCTTWCQCSCDKNSQSPFVLLLTMCFVSAFLLFRLQGNPVVIEYVNDGLMTSLHVQKPSYHVHTLRSAVTQKPTTQNITKAPVNKHGCESWFEDSMEENLEIIKNYPRGNADQFLSNISSVPRSAQTMTSFPVIVTAANYRFYACTQGLLKSIHEKIVPKYKKVKVIFYDMGLEDDQRAKMQKYCKCEIRTFPFDKFPSHMKRLKTYAWKPLIMKMLLAEYKWVWWMDSSVRFVTDELDSALKYSLDHSHLFFTYDVILSVAEQTDILTFTYLQEDPCKFRHFGEIEATFLLFYSNRLTDIIIDQWATCALNEACIAPPGTHRKLSCSVFNKSIGRCHRFDQSVIGILLRRLYHETNDYPLVDKPFHIHEIRRGEFVDYFPE